MLDANPKPWYLSRGFVGPLITALLLALRNLGVVELEPESTLAGFYQAAEFFGAIVGAYGRAAANRPIKVA